MNEILFFASILVVFSAVLLFHRLFGKAGLYGWTAFAIVYANIEVVKCVTLFGFETTLGNVLFGSTFLATDILSENYGKPAAKKAVYLGFATLCAFIVLQRLSLAFIPSPGDFAHEPMARFFVITPRVCLASIALYFVANILDVHLYHAIKRRLEKWMWLRNNVATISCQLLQAFFFCALAFGGVFPWRTVCEIALTTVLIECFVAVCDTPFLYLARGRGSRRLTRVAVAALFGKPVENGVDNRPAARR